MATILELKVAKRRLFEKLSFEHCCMDSTGQKRVAVTEMTISVGLTVQLTTGNIMYIGN